MMPTSGAVMCQSGTRIGKTKAIDSALKASKNVALPITTRAMTNQRDLGICSMRASKAAAACSDGNDGVGDNPAGASEHCSALTTDKGSLPFSSSVLPSFLLAGARMAADWRGMPDDWISHDAPVQSEPEF